MKAYLILEDGHVFEGESFGSDKEIISEFVFNTSMTGYTEVLTDPSYAGQSVVMTYPLIGNYGVSYKDQESNHPFVEGFVIHELSRIGSNFRMHMSLNDYMIENNIPGIQGVDTRAITKIIRMHGCMNGMITTHKYQVHEVLDKIKAFKVTGTVERCTCDTSYKIGNGNIRVALLDFGAKRNIAKELAKRGCEVTVLPASTKAKTMLALAHGFETEKLKFGHHGANHPVKDLNTGRVYISTQNHNYVIKDHTIDKNIAKPWFINVNDGTIEGMDYLNKRIKSVQFHPEASAGPHDTAYLFDEFIKMIGGNKNA